MEYKLHTEYNMIQKWPFWTTGYNSEEILLFVICIFITPWFDDNVNKNMRYDQNKSFRNRNLHNFVTTGENIYCIIYIINACMQYLEK